jgi:hypothetical protein
MFSACQAQIGLESYGSDGCHGERLVCERAGAAFGLQDGAGQVRVGVGLTGIAEGSVGKE